MSTVIRAPKQTHDALFAYDDVLRSASNITASSFDDLNVPANLFNGFTFDGWRPVTSGTEYVQIDFNTQVEVDFFAFYNTDAAEFSGDFKFQYLSGGVYVDAVSYSPVDNSPQLLTFEAVLSGSFRLVFENSAAPVFLSVVSFGKFLKIPYGLETSFNSPHLSQQYANITNTSETGNFIGRSVRKQSSEFNVSTKLLQYEWFRENWRPFIRHIERKPFFFKWSDSTYSDESVFVGLMKQYRRQLLQINILCLLI